MVGAQIRTLRRSLCPLLAIVGVFGAASSGWAAVITSTASAGNWSATSTWVGGIVPGAADDVIIANGAIVTLDTSTTINSLTVGQGVSGILQFGSPTGILPRTLTVSGSVTVASGGTLQHTNGGNQIHTLNIGGNLSNAGTFNLFVSSSRRIQLVFDGSTNATITGAGSFNLDTVTFNKSTATATVTNQTVNFFAISTDTITFQQGFYVHDNAGTWNVTNATGQTSVTVQANAGVRLLQGSMLFFTSTGAIGNNLTIVGKLEIQGGSVIVGTFVADEPLLYQTGSQITITTGSLICGSRIAPGISGNTTSYSQSGGTVTLVTVGSTSTTQAALDVNAAGSSFTMSAGSIIVERATSNASDVTLLAGTSSVTGGTFQFGDASTPSATTLRINSTVPVYNLWVNGSTAGATKPTLQPVTNALTALANVTVDTGCTLNSNNLNLVVGGNWTNNGTFTAGTAAVTFNGSSAQTIGGTANTTFNIVTLNNTSGLTPAIQFGDATNSGKVYTISGTFTWTAGNVQVGQGSNTDTVNFTVASASVTTPSGADLSLVGSASAFNVNGSTGTSGVTIAASGTLALTGSSTVECPGNWSNSGTFTANTSTVTFTATATGKTLAGTMTGATGKFYNLTFNGVGGGWSFGASAGEVANNLTLTNGTLTAPSTTLTLTGSYSNSGTFTHNSGTVTFNGTSSQALTGSSNTTFNVLNLSTGLSGGQSDTIKIGHSTAGSSITITATTLNIGTTTTGTTTTVNLGNNGTTDNTVVQALTVTGTLTINGTGTNTLVSDAVGALGHTIYVGVNWTNNGTFTANSSLVIFNGTGAQTIGGSSNTTFNSVELAPSAGITVTIANGLTITINQDLTALWLSGNLSVGSTSAATLTLAKSITIPTTLTAVSTSSINVGGNWTNNGTFTANSSTVTFNGTTQSILGSSSTSFNNLTINSGSTTTINPSTGINTDVSATLSVAGTLALANSRTLRLPLGTSSPATVSGTLTTSASSVAANKPTITAINTANPFKLTVSGTMNVDGLNFQYADASGLNFTGTAITNLRNIKFTNLASGATSAYLTLAPGAVLNIDCPGCFFDTGPASGGPYNVKASQTSGNSYFRFESRSDIENGVGRGKTFTSDQDNGTGSPTSANGVVVQWITAAGVSVPGNIQVNNAADALLGFPVAAHDGVTCAYYATYMTTTTKVYVLNSSGGVAYSYAYPQPGGAGDVIVGTPLWVTLNIGGTNYHMLFFGTTGGYLVALMDNGSALTVEFASPFKPAGLSEVDSPMATDNTNLYFGGRDGGGNPKVFAWAIPGTLATPFGATPVWTVAVGAAVRALPALGSSGGTNYLFAESDAVGGPPGVATAYRIKTAVGTLDVSNTVNKQHHIRGGSGSPLVKTNLCFGDYGGRVHLMDAFSAFGETFTYYDSATHGAIDTTTLGPTKSAIYGIPLVDTGLSTITFGDRDGHVYSIGLSGSILAGWPVAPDGVDAVTFAKAFKCAPVKGPGGFVWIGNTNGKVFKLNATTGVLSQTYNFGAGVTITGLSYDPTIGQLMVGTDSGKVYYINIGTDSPPSAPTSLLVEGLTNPTGVTDPTPYFQATHNDPEGDPALKYQIQVSTDSTFATVTHWDSGLTSLSSPVASGAAVPSATIFYAGTSLSWNTTYYWRIRFQDWDTCQVGAWSTVAATFAMGSPSTTLPNAGAGNTGWNMFVEPSGTSVTAAQLNSQLAFWWVFKWDETVRNYVAVATTDTLLPGKGYFLWTNTPAPTLNLSTGTAWKGSFKISTSANAVAADSNATFPLTFTTTGVVNAPYETTIDQYRGWHIIGHPYASAVSWQTGVTLSSVDTTYYYWDGSIQQYRGWNQSTNTAFNGGVTSINPFRGFWVHASATTNAITFADPTALAVPDPLPPPFTANWWLLQIKVDSGAAGDWGNYAGVHPSASDGWDPRDALDPGTLADPYVVASFPHDAWPDPRNGSYAMDVRHTPFTSGSTATWLFRVKVNTGAWVKLQWPNLIDIPPNWSFTITDTVTGVTTPLAPGGNVQFFPGAGVVTRDYLITATRSDSAIGILEFGPWTGVPASGVAPGTTGVRMVDFTIKAHVEDINLNAIVVHGNGSAAGVSAVYLFQNVGGDGTPWSGTNVLMGTSTYSVDNGSISFPVNFTVPQGQTSYWFVVYDFSASATGSYSSRVDPSEIVATGAITGLAPSILGATVTGGTKTIAIPAADGGGGGGGGCGCVGLDALLLLGFLWLRRTLR